MKRRQLGLIVLAAALILSSWIGIISARSGLIMRSLTYNQVPLIYLAPKQANAVPGVIIAHGFAGSKQLMLGYGHVLAQAGYAVMLGDFEGHGANPMPLSFENTPQMLDAAFDALLQQPNVDPKRLALLGHSMGSGIVMSQAIQSRDRYAATIAISPTGAEVTPQSPKNLQLQAGSGEGRFVLNAEKLLKQAGGQNTNLAQGLGRELVVVPNVEHITILFSDISHQAALRWLNETFAQPQPSSPSGLIQNYRDRRMAWYGLHLLGWLIGLSALSPVLAAQDPIRDSIQTAALVRQWLGLLLAPVVAVAGLVLLSKGLDLQAIGGVQVGGAVGLWFLLAGTAWLTVLIPIPKPTVRSILSGIVLFGVLWIAFGAMAQVVWLQWWLIPRRFLLWLPIAIACFPWFLASGLVQQNLKASQRVLWWIGQSAMLIGGFVATLSVLPQLGFIFLLLPLFPLLLSILGLVHGTLNRAWAYAIGSALFWGWLLAAGFPLSA